MIHAFSHLEGARVSGGAAIGPYARLRPGADVAAGAKIGNKGVVIDVKAGPIETAGQIGNATTAATQQ